MDQFQWLKALNKEKTLYLISLYLKNVAGTSAERVQNRGYCTGKSMNIRKKWLLREARCGDSHSIWKAKKPSKDAKGSIENNVRAPVASCAHAAKSTKRVWSVPWKDRRRTTHDPTVRSDDLSHYTYGVLTCVYTVSRANEANSDEQCRSLGYAE